MGLIQPFLHPEKSEHETRREELRDEEFDPRDAFEQRSYGREQTRTGVVLKGKEKPTKVW